MKNSVQKNNKHLTKKYAIHPGRIYSKNDGQIHYVGYWELIRLANLNPDECFLWDDQTSWLCREDKNNFIFITPAYGGNYLEHD